MARYIDAKPYKDMLIGKAIDVTIKAGKNFAPNDFYCEDFVKVANVNDIPTADVQEVKHAHWITNFSSTRLLCSNCKCGRLHQASLHGTYEHLPPFPTYCENCGAKMDLRG